MKAALVWRGVSRPRTLRKLIDHFGDLETFWHAPRKELKKAKISVSLLNHLLTIRQPGYLESVVDKLDKLGLQVIDEDDLNYPQPLKEISDPPLVLFVRGNTGALSRVQSLSVVGSRAITRYGETATAQIVQPLARAGITIVSGLALGVDGQAHRVALNAHSHTIAVLAGGLDWPSIGPRQHHQLAAEIIDQGGALISEQPPGAISHKGAFPLRNRIIAGMTPATLVVEAAEKSGALITAREALDQGRDVWAVPGPVTQAGSRGPNRLLADGALPALSAEAILTHYGWSPTPESIAHQLTADQLQITDQLRREPQTVDQLLAATGWPAAQLLTAITELEIAQIIRRQGDQLALKVDNLG
jgi:DNA processing protein